MADENELFLKEMEGVRRISVTEREALVKDTGTGGNQAERRRAALENKPVTDPNSLRSSEVPRVGPHDVIGFKRPGIQDGVFRKLRLGKYETEARLDLHRRTVEEARREVYRFVRDCIEADIRSVLMMPGKGDRNTKDPAVLKSYLAFWLEELEDVQAYHTAQPHHGGSGAFYVLLKKSERKKQLAREKFSKGRL
ncbi:MAG TPA: DNA endonuclease SmrA [Oceanospirillales bacterium]|nr:DNA endonuclease SmrA [Oceanospirillaceae bacterium]HBS41409.1 DNA endonuclease SmrA [Oceanospirillales bacterium]|tara:strand:- start:3511 stop:4095 length:585 start_codon:yes stop_codon:yes gene_type:complete